MIGDPEVVTLTTVEEFQRVEPGWRRLALEEGNLFLTPEWARSWFDHYGDRFAPSIRCVTVAGRVVGVLPLMHEEDGTVRFVGDGVGDIFGPLVDIHAPGDTLGMLIGTLRADRGALTVLSNVEKSAPWRARLRNDLALDQVVDRPQILPYLDLEGVDWPAFLKSRSANFRSQLGRKQRSLERLHEVRFRRTEQQEELATDMASFLRLHDERWAGRGGSSSSSQRMRAFLEVLCGRALAQDWLRLWTLDLDGTPAASWLGWKVGNRYSYYLAGFDPAHAERSPGLVLLAHTVKDACDEGAAVYDFLLGDEAYKTRFASDSREVETELLGARWHRRLLLGRVDHQLRHVGRMLPPPVRRRVRTAAGALERRLPLNRHR